MALFGQLLLPALVAAAIAAGVLLASSRWPLGSRMWGAGGAIGLGYVVGHSLVAGMPSFPPVSGTQWLICLAVLGAVAAVVDALVRPGVAVRAIVWLFVIGMATRLVLESKFKYGWSETKGWSCVATIALATLGFAGCLQRLERTRSGWISLYAIATVVATGTGVALMMSGSLLLGQLALIVAATSASCFVGLIALATDSMPTGAVAPLTLLLPGLWVNGYFYAELPASAAILLAMAPAAGLFRTTPDGLQRWRDVAVRTALAAVPVTVAVFLAFRASPPLD